MLVTPHDDAHALHSYDSALASRSALVLALRLGVFVSLAFLCPPQISVSPSSTPPSRADAANPRAVDEDEDEDEDEESLFTPTASRRVPGPRPGPGPARRVG